MHPISRQIITSRTRVVIRTAQRISTICLRRTTTVPHPDYYASEFEMACKHVRAHMNMYMFVFFFFLPLSVYVHNLIGSCSPFQLARLVGSFVPPCTVIFLTKFLLFKVINYIVAEYWNYSSSRNCPYKHSGRSFITQQTSLFGIIFFDSVLSIQYHVDSK